MSYEEQIRRERTAMSKSFAKLADFLLDSYIEASFMTASELAQLLNLDAATVVRFSQSLGYSGYPQLQKEIRQKVKGDLLIRPRQAAIGNSITAVSEATLRNLSRDLDQTRITLDTSALAELVNLLGTVHRTIVLSDAPAQPAAYNLTYFLEQGGFPVFVARPGVRDLARTLYGASPQDLVLAMDITGHSPFIANAILESRSRGIHTAAIVGTASLASARAASVVLAAQSYSSSVSGMVVINALVCVLGESLRWRYPERFAGSDQAIEELYGRLQQTNEVTS